MANEPYQIDDNAVWQQMQALKPAGAGAHTEAIGEDLGATTLPPKAMAESEYDDNLIWDTITGLVSGTRALPAGVIGGGGEALHQLYQHATGDPNAPQTVTEAGKRIGGAVVTSAVGTKVGEKLASTTQKVAKHFLEKPRAPGVEEAVQHAEQGMPYKGRTMAPPSIMPLTAAQQTDHNFYTFLENIAKGSGGGETMQQFTQQGQLTTKAAMEKFVDELGGKMTPTELGTLVGKTIAGERQAVLAPLKAAYNQLGGVLEAKSVRRMVLVKGEDGKMIPVPKMVLDPKTGAVINMKPLKQWAKQMLDPTHHTQGGQSATILKSLLDKPDEITYNAAKELKTSLEDMGYQAYMASNGKDQGVGMARRAANMVRKARMSAVEKYDPRTAQQLRGLDQQWSGESGRVNNDYLRKLIDTALDKSKGLPENIKADIITPQGISHLKRVKAAIGNTPTWGKLQAATLAGEIEKAGMSATDPTIRELNFKKLEQRLFGKGIESYETGLGKDVTDTLYTPEQIHWIKRTLNVGLQQQKKPVTDQGRMLIQMKTAGAIMVIGAAAGGTVGSAITGDLSNVKEEIAWGGAGGATAAGIILMTPKRLANIMTRPALAQYLVKGMTTPFNSPFAVPILTRLGTVLAADATKEQLHPAHPAVMNRPQLPQLGQQQ